MMNQDLVINDDRNPEGIGLKQRKRNSQCQELDGRLHHMKVFGMWPANLRENSKCSWFSKMLDALTIFESLEM